jgi:TonB family protein
MLNARVMVSLAIVIVAVVYSATQDALAVPASAVSHLFVPVAWEKVGKVAAPPACPAKFEDSLETNGIAPEGHAPGVKLPKPLHIPEAEFSERSRKEINRKGLRPFETVSTIALVIDTEGKPRDLCVRRSAEFDLDEQAAKVVRQYRFEPATKDDHPIAMRIKVEIRFAMR